MICGSKGRQLRDPRPIDTRKDSIKQSLGVECRHRGLGHADGLGQVSVKRVLLCDTDTYNGLNNSELADFLGQ